MNLKQGLVKNLCRGFVIGLIFFAGFSSYSMAQQTYDPNEITEPYFNYGKATSFTEIHGFLSLEFFDASVDGKNGGTSSFDLHHFYLFYSSQVTKNVTVLGELEVEHAESVRFDRVWAQYKLSPWMVVRIGRDYSPFGVEIRHYQEPGRIVESRPLTIDLLFDEWREVGIEWIGNVRLSKHGRLRWETMLSNGPRGLDEAGIQTRDNNSSKLFTGRLSYRYIWKTGYIDLGVSTAPAFAYDDAEELKASFFGADFRWSNPIFDLRAEYIHQRADYLPGNGLAPIFGADSWGYYILAAWRFVRKQRSINYLQAAVRLDEVHIVPMQEFQRRVTLGVAYSPVEHVIFRADYHFVTETEGPDLANNSILFGAVFDF